MTYSFKENIIFSKYFYYSWSGWKLFNREHCVPFIKPKSSHFKGYFLMPLSVHWRQEIPFSKATIPLHTRLSLQVTSLSVLSENRGERPGTEVLTSNTRTGTSTQTQVLPGQLHAVANRCHCISNTGLHI